MIIEDAVRTAKSATHFALQKCVSSSPGKFPEEGNQWPTSVTHFAEVAYLRPRTDQLQNRQAQPDRQSQKLPPEAKQIGIYPTQTMTKLKQKYFM